MANGVTEDEALVRAAMQRLAEGWNVQDGDAFAAPFADDADYVVIDGRHIRGRAAIAEGHRQIFSTVYRDSEMMMESVTVRFVRDDVALVHVQGKLVVGTGPLAGESRSTLGLTLAREVAAWHIVAFQNTPVQGR